MWVFSNDFSVSVEISLFYNPFFLNYDTLIDFTMLNPQWGQDIHVCGFSLKIVNDVNVYVHEGY